MVNVHNKLNNRKIIVLIQARMGSTRLPGKILFSFFDNIIIERIIKITKQIKYRKKIFILTGHKNQNGILEKIVKKNKIKIFFGSENNVLERFKKFIKKNNFEKNYILRITSDNYLIQPNILNKMIGIGLKKKCDYIYVKPLSHYSGELFKGDTLLKELSKKKLILNHVTAGIRKSKKLNIIGLNVNFMGINHKKYYTLDTIKDLILMKKIEQNFPGLKKINCINLIKKIQNLCEY